MTAPRRLQLRRGNTTAISTYVGAPGELIINTTDNTLRIHDGTTVGGITATVNTAAITDTLNSILNGTGQFANLIPEINDTYTLGNSTQQWRTVYVSDAIYLGGATVTVSGGNLLINGQLIQGGTNYGNIEVASFLTTYTGNIAALITANTAMRSYVDGQISAANAGVVSANLGMRGYVDSVNNQANLAIKGYTDDAIADANLYLRVYAAGLTSTANIGMRGYVDNSTNQANLALKGYVDNLIVGAGNYSNVNVAAYLTTFGYAINSAVTLANTIQANQIAQANLGMKGYVDSQSFYSNAKVATYLPTYNGNIANISINDNSIILASGGFIASQNLGLRGDVGESYTYLQLPSDADATTNPAALGNDNGNVRISALSQAIGVGRNWIFDYNGTLTFPDATTQTTAYTNVAVSTYLASTTAQTFGGNVTVLGNLIVNGTTSYISTNNLVINDNIVNYANANPADSLDLGFVAHRTPSGRPLQHTGLVRDAANNIWRLFSNVVPSPGNTVDFTNAVYDDLRVGNITSPTITALIANAATQSDLIITINANVTQANAGIKGYVDNSVSTANIGLKGYVDQGNTIQASAITSANLGIKGYVDNSVSTANIGLKGYVDQANTSLKAYIDGQITAANTNVGGGTSYGNSNVASYLISSGYVNTNSAYSNSNVASYTITQGFTNYSNVNVQTYTETIGLTNYSNVNAKAYTESMGLTNYSNVNLAAYLAGNVTAGNITVSASGQFRGVFNESSASSGVFVGNAGSGTPTPRVGFFNGDTNQNWQIDNYHGSFRWFTPGVTRMSIDSGGNLKVPSGNIVSLGDITTSGYFIGNGSQLTGLPAGYSNIQVATYLPTYTGNLSAGSITSTGNSTFAGNVVVQGNLQVTGTLTTVNATGLTISNLVVTVANSAVDSTQANGGGIFVAGANSSMLYTSINNSWTFSNPLVVANAGNVTAGYYIGSGQFLSSLPGYAYSNVNVKAYTENMGFANFSNVNVKAYTEAMGFANYSNVNVAAYLSTNSYLTSTSANIANYAWNTNVTLANTTLKSYVDGQITAANTTSYSNAKVATYLSVGGISNVSVAGNVTATYFIGNGALLTGIAASSNYSNVNVATYLPTYSGNIANVRLGASGVLTFPDGTTQTTAASGGGSSYSNSNVASYLITSGYVNTNSAYGNGNVTSYLPTHTGNVGVNNIIGTTPNVTLQANSYSSTFDIYGNVALGNATYPVQVYATGNISTSGYLFGNGAFLTGIVASGGSGTNYSNVNVQAYTETMGFQNYGNVNVAAYTSGLTNYSNVNTAAYLSTATITTTGNITAANFVGNISITGNVTGTQPNVTLQAGAYTSVFDNLGNVSVPQLFTAGNIQTSGYLFGNGAFLTGIVTSGGGSGTNYSNVNVQAYTETMGFTNYSNVNTAAYLSGASSVIIGNTNPYSIQSNNTTLLIGSNTAITNGGGTSPGATYILNNVYFDGNGQARVRNTSGGGLSYFTMQGGTLYFQSVSGSVTANATTAAGTVFQASTSGFSTVNSIGISASGNISAALGGLNTSATQAYLYNATATTIYLGGAATTISIGASTGTTTVNNSLTVVGALSRTGAITTTAWGSSGVGLKLPAASYTDTSSSGTQGTLTAIHAVNGPTIAASSATTYTNLATFYIGNAPALGTNASATNRYSLYVNQGAYFASTNTSNSTTTGGLIVAGGVGVAGNIYAGENVVATGNVTATNFIGSGALLTSLPGYAYSDANVAAYVTTNGLTNYSNINLQAYLGTNSYLTSTTANLSTYAWAANVTAANVGMKGYVDSLVGGSSSYGNSNVASYLTTYLGNVQSANLTSNTISVQSYIDFDLKATQPAYKEGRLYYDAAEETLVLWGDSANVEIAMGQREWVRCRNSTANTIPKGSPVYATGVHIAGHPTHGHHPTIDLADASDVNKKDVIGITGEDILPSAHGYVIVRGYIEGLNTANLTAGKRAHLGFNPAGSITTIAPEYPNYPMDLGLCLTANATVGTFYVDMFDHSVERFRVEEGAYIDGDLTVGGNLAVLGINNVLTVKNLQVQDSWTYLAIGNIATGFSGTGLSDGVFTGHYTGGNNIVISVRIDSEGLPDTFKWSTDNFSTLEGSNVAIAKGEDLYLRDGVSIKFSANTGHTLNDTWIANIITRNLDFGVISNYVKNGQYTHAGLFRDASADKFRFFNSYNSEIYGNIDITDGSFAHADLEVGVMTASQFIGDGSQLTGINANYSNIQLESYLGSLNPVKLGAGAGATSQGSDAVAVGRDAGNQQGTEAVAVGVIAGQTNQGSWAVAIGSSAGTTNQGTRAVAIGVQAAETTQGTGAVAIGAYAGDNNQGDYAVAIGTHAGDLNQPDNSIILNASGNSLNVNNAGLYINPVRNDLANIANVVYYNAETNELTYAPAATSSYGNVDVATYLPTHSGNITAGNIVASGNITAQQFISTGAGTATLSAATNLDLSANTAVRVVGGGTFRLPQLTTANRDALIAANGDIIYNTSLSKFQTYEGGAWANVVEGGSGSSTYSNVNVAAYVTTNGLTNYSNVNVAAYVTTNGLTNYSNVNVATYLSGTSSVIVGNTNPYSIQANVTQVFVGNQLALYSGYGTTPTLATLSHNLYYDAAGAQRYRNTQTGAAQISLTGANGFQFQGTTTSVTANAASGIALWAQITSTGIVTYNSLGITSAGTLTTSTGVLASGATTGTLFNTVATTVNLGGAATAIAVGASNVVATFGSGTGNIVAGNVLATGAVFNNVVVNTGNINAVGGYFVGNGYFLTGIVGSSSYSNVQVATYLPTYSGNIVAANVWTTGNSTGAGALIVGPAGYTVLPITLAQFTGNANTYAQINAQNLSTGSDSSTEIVATANNGTDTTFFVDLGIAGSNYDPTSPNNSLGTLISANDGYVYAQGNTSAALGGNLAVGTTTSGKAVKIFAGGPYANAVIITANTAGATVQGNLVATGNIVTSGYIVTGGGYGNISQVDTITANTVIATANLQVAGNITAVKFFGDGSALSGIGGTYSNVNVATYLPTYSGNVANIRLGVSGVLTFADGTTMTTATAGGSSGSYINSGTSNVVVSSANVRVFIGGTVYANVTANNTIITNDVLLYSSGALKVPSGANGSRPGSAGGTDLTGMIRYNTTSLAMEYYDGSTWQTNWYTSVATYSNVQVATYLASGNASGYINTTGNISASQVAANYMNPANLLVRGSVDGTGSINVSGTINTSGNITTQGYLFGNGSQLTGLPATYSNVQVATYLPTYDGAIQSSNVQTTTANIQATTAATNTATGALRVMGGAAIGGNLKVGANLAVGTTESTAPGNLRVFYTTPATSSTTGALVVAGGVGIAGNLHVSNFGSPPILSVKADPAGSPGGQVPAIVMTGNIIQGSGGSVTYVNLVGNVTISNTAPATNTTGGALVVTGGVGIGGNLHVGGIAGITMPNRPAFRVYGSGVTANQNTANTCLKGSVITVDYNQGNYFNSTTGQFVVPFAGLYQVHLIARVGNNNGLNQIGVLKNGVNTAGNVVCFWETDTNVGVASHFGTSSVVKLAVGDYLAANIIAGEIQFDNNDSWSVTYLG